MTTDLAPSPPGPEPLPARANRFLLDLLFGIVLPLGCLAFDPIVFRGGSRGGMAAEYAVVGYTAAGLGMVSMLLWHLVGRPAGLFAGLLAGGAAFALALGLVMLPLTLVGLFVCVGVFGLVPFGTAWVFARNARRAWRSAGTGRLGGAVAGFALACCLPWVADGYVRHEVDRASALLMSPDPGEAEHGAELLGRFRYLVGVDFDDLVWKYNREEDPARRETLARAYHRLTGQDIEDRLADLD